MKIVLEAVSFSYPGGVEALREVSLTIETNESVALIGENGAGKTTLAKHLNGLLKPASGRVFIGNWDTHDYSVARLAGRVGLAFQNPNDQLFARTVGDEVAFGPRNLGHDSETIHREVNRALVQVGLDWAMERHPYDLAAPERKLVALAAILAMRTPVIILDEPTMGQDARGIDQVSRIVAELRQEGRTVLAISHDIDFCAENFERIVVMAGGRVTADGPAGDVLSQSRLLAESQIEAPQMVRLARALDLPAAPLTVPGFLQALKDKE